MDLLNIDDCSKSLAFKKYYPKFVKAYKIQPNRLDIRQFLVLLYDYAPNMFHIWSIDRLLKNAYILKSGADKNSATALYSETAKLKLFLTKKWL